MKVRHGLLGFFACVAAMMATPAAASSILIQPTTSTVSVGDKFSVDIFVADILDFYSYQFDLSFDSTVLQADGVTNGTVLASDNFFEGLTDNTAGRIEFVLNALTGAGPGVDGNGVISAASFIAIALNTTRPGSSARTAFSTAGSRRAAASWLRTSSVKCGV